MMQFEELDQTTRGWMLKEFDDEQLQPHYISRLLTNEGKIKVPAIVRESLQNGNELTLFQKINVGSFWLSSQTNRKGVTSRVDADDAAMRYALSEFSTWYVRGLSRKLIEEGIEKCQIYRAGPADAMRAECSCLEGRVIDVRLVYDGHRARYFPIFNDSIFAIPSGPNCHHLIRRVRNG